jgi:hypothetical protein
MANQVSVKIGEQRLLLEEHDLENLRAWAKIEYNDEIKDIKIIAGIETLFNTALKMDYAARKRLFEGKNVDDFIREFERIIEKIKNLTAILEKEERRDYTFTRHIISHLAALEHTASQLRRDFAHL